MTPVGPSALSPGWLFWPRFGTGFAGKPRFASLVAAIKVQRHAHFISACPVLASETVNRRYVIENKLAERERFELSVELLTLRRFSKPLLSTTQPPLRF